jgi:hypothetical protein
MATGQTADRRIDSNVDPAASTISDNLHLDENTRLVGADRPRFPLAVWTPPLAPMVMGNGGIWARSLIEMMFAAANR